MIVVAFYTNEKYRACAVKMHASAEAFGLSVMLYGYPEQADWRDAVNLKPQVILRAMQDYPKDSILYVDADCTFVQAPMELLTVDADPEQHYDAAMYHQLRHHPQAGTLWFRNSARGRNILERWAKNIATGPRIADDLNLKDAFLSIQDRRIYHLPPAYCWHEKTMRPGFGRAVPVIVQESVGEHTFSE